MTNVLILVEGQTEETVVRDTLYPHLLVKGIFLQSVILRTKREKSGKTFKGGVSSFAKVERDLRALLGDTSVAAVTTLIDYYGLPRDFPGLASVPAAAPQDRVAHVENAFGEAINNPRFIPHLTLHEMEAWVFVAPDKCAGMETALAADLRLIRDKCGGPEQIDEGPETAPSKRILHLMPAYQKVLHGSQAINEIGMEDIRHACPHADHWLRRLEDLH